MHIALTRGVSASLAFCELTHMARTPMDLPLARSQHASYEDALRSAGCRVIRLPLQDECPDAVFVEDSAIVLDEIAVVTRPGAVSRRPEVESVAQALAEFRETAAIEEPGTLDGGDVLRLGRRVYVGRSGRSNQAGIEQLRTLLAPHGYSVTGVPVTGCLHLKSAVTEISPGVVLVNRRWVDSDVFGDAEIADVDPAEPYAANGLLIASQPVAPPPAGSLASSVALDPAALEPAQERPGPGAGAGLNRIPNPESPIPTDHPFVHPGRRPWSHSTLIYPASFPRTRARLEARGIPLEIVDVSELQKAEGAVTCCSIVFEA